jgi:transposase InsO family protein
MRKDTKRHRVERKVVEALIAGKSQKKIKEEIGVGSGRLAKIIAKAEAAGYLNRCRALPPFPESLWADDKDGRANRESEADQFLRTKTEWIKECLEAGWHPISVFEELGETPSVSRASFYRFLHRHGIYRLGETERRRVVPEIVSGPGEVLQIDWGKLRDVVGEDGKKKSLWAFVGVMGFSRYRMVRLVWTNDVETTVRTLESMFRELGGVPRRLISDNPKCFALEASPYEPLVNPAYERFASHYGFTIECLPPSDPQKKGKVERQMPFMRRLYEAHGATWHGVDESQAYMDRKLRIANERRHGTTQRYPLSDFIELEVSKLLPLAAVEYAIEECAESSVRKDGHVRFRNKYYSVDETHIGSDVFVIGSQETVRIYRSGKLIETHERLHDPYRSKQTKSHHLKPWEAAMNENSYYRRRAAELGPEVERLVMIIIEQGHGMVDTRKVFGIMSLAKKYAKTDLNRACAKALEAQSYSYRTVLTFLRLTENKKAEVKAKATNVVDLTPRTYTRDLSVYENQLRLVPRSEPITKEKTEWMLNQ